jgi:pimeloyl-ACP methyl ester carboxylesterase
MKKVLICLVAVLSMTITACKNEQLEPENFQGSWLGTLDLGAQSLRLVINLSSSGDSLTATMDSPDQGAYGIPAGPVTITDDNIVVAVKSIAGEYSGKLVNDTLIEGTWSQAGSSLPLDVVKNAEVLDFRKPQEPVEPFPYIVEEVSFRNDVFDIELAGTLTLPEGEGPFKTVILITGSGPQNRDEELMGHKPFLVIADYLTRNGIAVLRYDDRGVGASEGYYTSATSADLATDVDAAFNFLKTVSMVDTLNIGLMGHSEGGLIAPMVASENKEIAFIVSLAGPGVNGMEVIIRQSEDISRLMGLKQKKIDKSMAVNSEIYNIILNEPDNETASAKVEQYLRDYLKKRLIFKKLVDIQVKGTMSSMTPDAIVWLRFFFQSDPDIYWSKVQCPVLALNGDKDMQVASAVNLPAIVSAVKSGGNDNVESIELPGLNHLFQHSETGNPSEYGAIEETFSPEALNIITEWINKL